LKRIGVLASGRGSNLQALLDASTAGAFPGRVAVVVSNVAGAPALDRARAAGVPTHFVSHVGRPREDFDREVAVLLHEQQVDLVCLAGFLRVLSPAFLREFPHHVVNVHPSLLPAFPGLEAQRQALDYGARVSGATVHLVDEGLDSGPVILQEAVPVLPGDSVESLSARILEAEHRLYPRAVRLLLEGDYRLEGRRLILGGS
jgi:phosphoribosylglycinamide formyltransferase-1